MRTRLGLTTAIVLAAALVSACASSDLTVTRVTANTRNTQGIRYSLPKPFLVVKPNPVGDGSFTVELVYLPNEDETYAVSGRTKRGKYSLDVVTKGGLLKKISWNAEGTADIDAAALKTASELAKASIDKREEDQKKAEAAREAERKAAQADVKTAEEAADNKALALKLAELELKSAQAAVANPNQPTAEERKAIREAELKRDKASAELLDAQTRLAQKRARLSAASNAPAGTQEVLSKPPQFDLFWGPIIYEIRDDGKTVELLPVKWTEKKLDQREFETATANPPPETAAAGSGTGGAMAKLLSVSRKDSVVVITLSAAKAVKSIDVDQVTLFNTVTNSAAAETPTATFSGDGKQITITYKKLSPGSYTLLAEGMHTDKSRFSVALPVDVK